MHYVTLRGVLLGLALAMCLSAFSYYNDWVVVQHGLTGTLLPIGVFGVLAGVILLVNPLLHLIHASWPLQPRELVVIVVLGLAACSYPGGAFSRLFAPMVLMPGRLLPAETSWQGANVLSYVPGGSAELSEGQVRDWAAFSRVLERQAHAAKPNPGKRVLAALPPDVRRQLAQIAGSAHPDLSQHRTFRRSLNRTVLDAPSFYDTQAFAGIDLPQAARKLLAARAKTKLSPWQVQHLNRALLVAAYPKAIRPVPSGTGVLLLGGRSDPNVTAVTVGGAPKWVGLFDLPWGAWWPVIRLWGGLFLLLAAASFCIVLIVHPQWSRHEVLPYPIVQIGELMIRRDPGRWLPNVTRSPMFWYGFGAMILLSIINGLHSWFPGFPVHIPQRYNFMPLVQLFPNAPHVSGWWSVFDPFLLPIAVAFAYFLNLRVSFSMGISMFLYMALCLLMIKQGISVHSAANINPTSMMLFGAGVGFVVAILYYGRRHYWAVLRS